MKYFKLYTGLLMILLVVFVYKNLIAKPRNLKGEVKKMENITLNAKIVTDRGDINLKLFPGIAPFTVLNFVNLSNRGYYDGLKFHRVIEDFMIQGGDPTGTGAGGPGYNFIDEFQEGITFSRKGILAMANAGPNTNGSQFFITHVETPWLNYKHTIFGEVVSDEDQKVVDSVKQGDIIKTIEITGDVDKFLSESDNKEILGQMNEALDAQFPNLKK